VKNSAPIISNVLMALSVLLFASTAPYAGSFCEEEYPRARLMVSRIESEWPLRNQHESISRYLQLLIDEMARSWREGHSASWHTRIVRDYSTNAYSVGAGYVYVTEGVIQLCRTESELAAILAHEMGHELAGHFCVQETRNRRSLYNPFGFKGLPLVRRGSQIEKGSLIQEFDPEKEREADQIGIGILRTTRFDVHAMLVIARRLSMGDPQSGDSRRIETLKSLVREIPLRSPSDSNLFLEMKQNLLAEHHRYGP
jgi:beta-barrel assembly-enhancing protease